MIIDASVAAAWFLDEPHSDEARALLRRTDLAAPALILAEVGQSLYRAKRNRRITAETAATAMDTLAGAFDMLHESAELAGEALQIALSVSHPVSDCLYMALARRLSRPLISEDAAMRRAAARYAAIETYSLADWSARNPDTA